MRLYLLQAQRCLLFGLERCSLAFCLPHTLTSICRTSPDHMSSFPPGSLTVEGRLTLRLYLSDRPFFPASHSIASSRAESTPQPLDLHTVPTCSRRQSKVRHGSSRAPTLLFLLSPFILSLRQRQIFPRTSFPPLREIAFGAELSGVCIFLPSHRPLGRQ